MHIMSHTQQARSTPASPPTPENDEIDLLQLVRTLWRGKFWIILTTVLALFLGGFFTFKIAVPEYTARAVVALQSRQEQVVDLESVVSGLSGDQTSINTEVEVLRSRGLIEKLVRDLDLTADPEFNPRLRPTSTFSVVGLKTIILGSEGPEAGPSQQEILDATVNAVLRAVSISNLRQSYVFNITAVTTDPVKSARIANTLAELYILDQVEVKFEATEQATTWLTNRVTDLQAELETAEADVKAFMAGTQLISPEGLEALNRQIKDTRERLDGVKRAEAEHRTRLTSLSSARASEDPEQMVQAASDVSLNRIFQDGGARSTLIARFDLLYQNAEQEVDRAAARARSLELALAKFEEDYTQQSDDLVVLQQLQREAEASRLIYEFFLSRLKETAVQEGIQQADSRILSRAAVPTGASAPRSSMILALSMILGLLIGSGFVLIREMLHSGFRTADELSRETGHTVLGQIPRIPGKKRHSVVQYLADNPTSAAAEAVRNLRTSILLSNVDEPPKVIMITSSVPGEGKTTAAISLAHNFVGLGKKVLLIEGDIRRRVFSEYFDLKNRKGLLSVLSQEVVFEEAVKTVEPLGADVLIGEESTTNAADVFSSDRFQDFINAARVQYDVIIIDTPPVLVVPDARVIAQVADAVIYSVHWDSTGRKQVTEGLNLLETGDTHVSGLVLGQIDAKGMKRYGFDGYYGAYSEYGRGYYGT